MASGSEGYNRINVSKASKSKASQRWNLTKNYQRGETSY